MMNNNDMGDSADLFSALGSDTRVRMLQELRGRPLCVGALAMRLELTQSAISQHLRILRNAGLVESDKRGSYVHYSLAGDVRARCRRALDDVLPESEHDEGNSERRLP